MIKLFKKLNNKGLTMIHAVIGVLLLTMMSSVIYVAVMSNIKAYASEKKNQQAYLTVSSAVDIFVNSLQGDKIFYTVEYSRDLSTGDFSRIGTASDSTWVYTENANYMSNPLLKIGKSELGVAGEKGAFYSDFLSIYKEMYVYYEDGLEHSVTKTYTIGNSTTGTANEIMPAVQVDVTYKNYWIYANFSVVTDDEDSKYYMCVQIPVTKLTTFVDTQTKDAAGNITKLSRKYELDIAEMEDITIDKGAFTW